MVTRTRRSVDLIDPLSRAIAPPATETAAERAVREAKEAEGRRINDLIDEQIKLEKQANARKKPPVKLLMLGQAESGAPLFTRVYSFPTRLCSASAFRKNNHSERFSQLTTFPRPYTQSTSVIQSSRCLTLDKPGRKNACHGAPSST